MNPVPYANSHFVFAQVWVAHLKQAIAAITLLPVAAQRLAFRLFLSTRMPM